MAGVVNVTWDNWVLVPSSSPNIELNNQSRIGDVFVYVGAVAPDASTSDWQLWSSDQQTRKVEGIPPTHRIWLKGGSKVAISVDWRPISIPDVVNMPDEGGYGLVGSVARRFVDDFGGTALDATKWDVEMNTGGMSYTVGASDLNVVMGTTINAELRLLSKAVFTSPVDLFVSTMFSQRLNENGVWFEFVEVDPTTLQPVVNPNLAGDWNNRVALRLQGSTSVNNAAIEGVSQGSNSLSFATTTSAATTTSNADFNLRVREADIWLGSVATDSNGSRSSGEIRLSRQVPDPDKLYKFRMRFKNAATAPASSTTVTVRSVRILDIQEMQVDYSASGSGSSGNALPITGSLGVTLFQGTSWNTNTINHKLISGATTNPTVVKSSSGKIVGGLVTNTVAALRYLKLYNKASAPTVGTDIPSWTIPLPQNVPVSIEDLIGPTGHSFTTGISYAITSGAADSDTGAIGAGDVLVNLTYL